MDKKSFGKQLQRYRERAGTAKRHSQNKSSAALSLFRILNVEKNLLALTLY